MIASQKMIHLDKRINRRQADNAEFEDGLV